MLSVARSEDTLAAGMRDGSIYLVNLLTSEVRSAVSRNHHLPVRCLAFNPTHQLLFSGSDDGLCSILASESNGERVGVLKGHLSAVLGVAVSHTLVATASADRKVRVWQLPQEGDVPTTKEPMTSLEAHAGQVFCVGFALGRERVLLASGGAGGELQLYRG